MLICRFVEAGELKTSDSYVCSVSRWGDTGFQSSLWQELTNRSSPFTKKEVKEIAQDIAVQFISTGFHKDDCWFGPRLKVTAVRYSKTYDEKVIDSGWDVTLSKSDNIINIRIRDDGIIQKIDTIGTFVPAYLNGAVSRTANEWTTEALDGTSELTAALNALNVVRVLENSILGVYVQKIQQDDTGNWRVDVGILKGAVYSFCDVVLSGENYGLLYYERK